jgi:hypothetical protein
MRVLYVIELRDSVGGFYPKVGFARMDLLEKWIAKYLAQQFKIMPGQWRIVRYIPEVIVENTPIH